MREMREMWERKEKKEEKEGRHDIFIGWWNTRQIKCERGITRRASVIHSTSSPRN